MTSSLLSSCLESKSPFPSPYNTRNQCPCTLLHHQQISSPANAGKVVSNAVVHFTALIILIANDESSWTSTTIKHGYWAAADGYLGAQDMLDDWEARVAWRFMKWKQCVNWNSLGIWCGCLKIQPVHIYRFLTCWDALVQRQWYVNETFLPELDALVTGPQALIEVRMDKTLIRRCGGDAARFDLVRLGMRYRKLHWQVFNFL